MCHSKRTQLYWTALTHWSSQFLVPIFLKSLRRHSLNLMRIQVTDVVLIVGLILKTYFYLWRPDSLVFAVLSLNFFKKLETSFTESDEDTGYRCCLDCRSHFEDLLDVKRHSLCLKNTCRVSTNFHSHSRHFVAENVSLVCNELLFSFISDYLTLWSSQFSVSIFLKETWDVIHWIWWGSRLQIGLIVSLILKTY